MYRVRGLIIISVHVTLMAAELGPKLPEKPVIAVNKCCESYEVMVKNHCTHINQTNETMWYPTFTSKDGRLLTGIEYKILNGNPDCGSTQKWPIYHYQNSSDVLKLLPNGVLRHYLFFEKENDEEKEEMKEEQENSKGLMFQDYVPGKYCLEKRIDENLVSEYALVCAPEHHKTDWTSTKFLLLNIINPVTHAVNIACFLIIAIVYFIMPTLRDLVGNIITTLLICLIIYQAADMTRLLTIFTNHISIIIAEIVCYIALLAAFFWINSLGYYIWKTFRSRNVFLRITDKKKYCYYSIYVWSCTILMGFLAVFGHFALDYPQVRRLTFEGEQEAIGSLGIIIFFVPVAFTILVNVFFFAATVKVLNRMNTYGRIHHKLKHSFRMFLLLFLEMTIAWLFFLLSFSKYDGLVYCYVIVNTFQGPLILYICVFNQRHVSYLIRKTCCYSVCACSCCRPEPECEWGDEMTAMNTGIY
ncbi:probable G-protein coupled receptor Mth-like 5 [Agrilus planipennis]|uniref:Probable G-protein coupled receptor Mth-like 5 n=1 Tax=Agrilus planipennis TaxID=224129 RepID=A0A1W4WWD5_AGRPL|nr:probable G-protein coupled receptor Mth-like 5 [Agrilus planipennis]